MDKFVDRFFEMLGRNPFVNQVFGVKGYSS